jgi:hypothetical protein
MLLQLTSVRLVDDPAGVCCRRAPMCAGGWTFYGLYAACQAWWFLVICLSAWAFILVACSFALSGREFLFPVALVTSFIGESHNSAVSPGGRTS